MFIYVTYKDPAELSIRRQPSDTEVQIDMSTEKVLLVNPNCYIRVMLEYIRKSCKLAETTQFDLCDDTGKLLGLFNYATYTSAQSMFEPKKNYYLIVTVTKEAEKGLIALPQVNRENKLYLDLQGKVKRYLASGDESPPTTTFGKSPATTAGKSTPSRKK